MTILEKVKIRTAANGDNDSLLTLLIDEAKDEFCAYTNNESVPEAAENVIVIMVCSKYNAVGSEGLSATNYSGFSETYEGYSKDVIAALNRWRKVGRL